MAIRGALGARPRAIFAQFLTEGLTLAIFASVIGLAAGYAMLRGLVAMIPTDALPAEADLRLNLPILLIMLGINSIGFGPDRLKLLDDHDNLLESIVVTVIEKHRVIRNAPQPPSECLYFF